MLFVHLNGITFHNINTNILTFTNIQLIFDSPEVNNSTRDLSIVTNVVSFQSVYDSFF